MKKAKIRNADECRAEWERICARLKSLKGVKKESGFFEEPRSKDEDGESLFDCMELLENILRMQILLETVQEKQAAQEWVLQEWQNGIDIIKEYIDYIHSVNTPEEYKQITPDSV